MHLFMDTGLDFLYFNAHGAWFRDASIILIQSIFIRLLATHIFSSLYTPCTCAPSVAFT